MPMALVAEQAHKHGREILKIRQRMIIFRIYLRTISVPVGTIGYGRARVSVTVCGAFVV